MSRGPFLAAHDTRQVDKGSLMSRGPSCNGDLREHLARIPLPWVGAFFGIWQQLAIHFYDDAMVSRIIGDDIHIQAKVNGTHDGVAAFFMDDGLDGRPVGINDFVKTVENRICIPFVGMRECKMKCVSYR